jgi:aryl carrier-like protein
MVPAAYVRLAALPVTSSGKVDRKALPAPDAAAYATGGYEPPDGPIETALALIWAQVLDIDRVGRHDNFFRLGGHSLVAMTLVERMRQHGFAVDVGRLFATPTIAELTPALDAPIEMVSVPENRIPGIRTAPRGLSQIEVRI